jgi:hypothetical protein
VSAPQAITRHADGTAVTFSEDAPGGNGGWSGTVVATLRHGDWRNAGALAGSASFLVEAGCTHVTRVRVTEVPPGCTWRPGAEVDVPTMYLSARPGR